MMDLTYDFQVIKKILIKASLLVKDDSLDNFHSNNISMSRELLACWEKSAENSEINALFQNWLVQNSSGENKFQMVQLEPQDTDTDINIAIKTCQISKTKIIIGDNFLPQSRHFPNIKFCKENLFFQANKSIHDFSIVENYFQNNILRIFPFFLAPPVQINVPANRNSEILAQYLAEFYDENILIQDLFFVTNEPNFNRYIVPHIKPNSSLTIVISTEDGKKHKQRIEKKYSNCTVKCYDKKLLHEGFISTQSYKINLGYRLLIFGDKGKTNKESISIFPK